MVLAFGACEAANLGPIPESIAAGLRLNNVSLTLDRGDTARITASIVGAGGSSLGNGSTLVFNSSDPSIATVSRSGLVLAHREGQVAINVNAGNLKAASSLKVKGAGKQLIVSPKIDTIFALGNSLQLSAVVLNPAGKETSATIAWSTRDPSIATVSSTGLVKALAAGTASIVASSDGHVDIAQVVVKPGASPVPVVAMVQITPGDLETEVKEVTRFTAAVTDGSGTPMPTATVVWSTSDPAIATVNAIGEVTAKTRGSVKIRATAEGKSGTASVSVVSAESTPPPAATVQVTPGEANGPIGSSTQFSATVKDDNGNVISGAIVSWSTSNPAVASVNSAGLVTGLAKGSVNVYATVQGKIGSAFFNVLDGSEPPPAVAKVAVSPAAADISVGATKQYTALVTDANGLGVPGATVTWLSSHPLVATVSASGLVTAIATGSAQISATSGGKTGSATANVVAGAVAPPTGEWHKVLSDITVQGDVIVPDGEKWLIGANVRISGNLRTDGGTIAMRPGSSLYFVGANPEQYVGGGMRYDDRFSMDWGIWVGGTGVLDIRGTPKVGWNRTGSDPSWKSGDELWIAPTAVGDVSPRRWYPGQPIPRIDPRVPAAEVMNVTRDVLIEGPAHIHISSSKPQRIEYVTFRGLGTFKPNVGKEGATTGRYALHLHMQGEGSRGTVVRGVAAINSGGRVYVPHTSHGVTFEDVVSVNSLAEAFWWDPGDQTNDLVVNRLSASGVDTHRSLTGNTPRFNVVELPFGTNKSMTNSAASGGANGRLSVGFSWDGGAKQPTQWTFRNNVSHNNGTGIRFWNNSGQPHHIFDNVAYRNGIGLENGAYNNTNRFTDLLLIENGLYQNASSNRHELDGGPARFTNMRVEAPTGPALEIGGRNLAGHTYAEFIDSEFSTSDGSPKVFVGARANPWFAHFISTNVLPGDIVWDLAEDRNEGSHVIIEQEDGRIWDIFVKDGKVVTKLR